MLYLWHVNTTFHHHFEVANNLAVLLPQHTLSPVLANACRAQQRGGVNISWSLQMERCPCTSINQKLYWMGRRHTIDRGLNESHRSSFIPQVSLCICDNWCKLKCLSVIHVVAHPLSLCLRVEPVLENVQVVGGCYSDDILWRMPGHV